MISASRRCPTTNPPSAPCATLSRGRPTTSRQKLWAVMRIGSGDYAAGEWDLAIADAVRLADSAFISELADEADLHDRLMKGLYELGIAERS